MKDRVLTYAIVISVVVHFAVAVVVGQSFASRLQRAPEISKPMFVNVDLIDDSKPLPAKAVKVNMPVRNKPISENRDTQPVNTPLRYKPNDYQPDKINPRHYSDGTQPARVSSNHIPGNPGGRLNVGSASSQGDLAGDWDGGRTSVGWVPGDDKGRGKGSGSGEGVGAPEPPRHIDDGPRKEPPPVPVISPPPAKVSVKVCSVSGLLPGKYCERTKTEVYIEGQQSTSYCNQCKAPEPVHISRLADRANAELIKDADVDIRSLEEGLRVSVVILYTVKEDGSVADVEITKSSGIKAVDRAVLKVAQKMKYKPAVQDGIARSTKKTRTYNINT